LPVVEIEDLWYKYRASKDWVLRGIDFSVEEGEFVVIMGPSGCGKSTLCYTLNGIIPHLFGGDLRGKVVVDGMDTRKHSTAELSQRVGMVFQNPDTQLVALTVEDEVAFGPENLALPREEIRRRVEEALQLARLTEARKRSPHSLTYVLSSGNLLLSSMTTSSPSSHTVGLQSVGSSVSTCRHPTHLLSSITLIR